MPDTPRNVTDSRAPDDEQNAAPEPARAHRWKAVKAGGRVCEDCLQVQVRGKLDDVPDCPGVRP